MRSLFSIVLMGVVASASLAYAQFNGGSTGADGALNFTTPGTFEFDPAGLGVNPSGDNVFNFTTINVAQGVTLRFRSGRNRGKAVIWRATGAVTIAGVLDLSGANGIDIDPANPSQSRRPAEPGPGGFWGGLGELHFLGTSMNALPALGPGAVPANNAQRSQGASHATPGLPTQNLGGTSGPTYGNASLTPLLGGSGGAGQDYNCTGASMGHGGGGGGAIRIISNSSITISSSGSVRARGGNGGAPDPAFNSSTSSCVTSWGVSTYFGGGGSGGAIHLIAPTVTGAGSLDAGGGTRNGIASGGLGRVLISSNTNSLTGSIIGVSYSSRLALPSAVTAPSVTITSINGVSAPANPAGDPAFPDITFAATGQVTVNLAATNIPVGTVVRLTIVPESGSAQTVNCNPLSGSVASSVSNCSASFPSGVSLSSVRVTW